MNSLNSVLIEGNLISNPILENNICKFSICSDRFYKNENNDLIKEISYFNIEATGRLGETCNKELKKNRGVRVVGRIKQLELFGKMTIIAEHVEFKPIIKEKS
jgi:single-strand DNA-binding protein